MAWKMRRGQWTHTRHVIRHASYLMTSMHLFASTKLRKCWFKANILCMMYIPVDHFEELTFHYESYTGDRLNSVSFQVLNGQEIDITMNRFFCKHSLLVVAVAMVSAILSMMKFFSLFSKFFFFIFFSLFNNRIYSTFQLF